MKFEVGLFEIESGGVRIVGRSTDPQLVADARALILADRRAEVARLARSGDAPHPRPVRPHRGDDSTNEGQVT